MNRSLLARALAIGPGIHDNSYDVEVLGVETPTMRLIIDADHCTLAG